MEHLDYLTPFVIRYNMYKGITMNRGAQLYTNAKAYHSPERTERTSDTEETTGKRSQLVKVKQERLLLKLRSMMYTETF